MSSTSNKRLRKDTGAVERLSDAPSPQLLDLIKMRFQEQTEAIAGLVREAEMRILSSISERLDSIADEVKQTGVRVSNLEREVADLRSQREQLCERVDHLQREVADMRAMRERVGTVEAKLAAQNVANNAFDLRIHGVPYVEGENLRTLFNQLCFSLHITPPPRVRDIFPTQKSNMDPVIIIKMESVREKVPVLKAIAAYRRESKTQLSLKFVGYDSDAAIYINEQLQREHYQIFKESMRLKKHKVLVQYLLGVDLFMSDCKGCESVHCVEHMDELLKLTENDSGSLPLSSSPTLQPNDQPAALESFRS